VTALAGDSWQERAIRCLFRVNEEFLHLPGRIVRMTQRIAVDLKIHLPLDLSAFLRSILLFFRDGVPKMEELDAIMLARR